MNVTAISSCEAKRKPETSGVEDLLRQHFDRDDCYRYNSASIRVRVVDSKFESESGEKRDAMVEAVLDQLPAETQRDILTLFALSPSEQVLTPATFREFIQNVEFDNPSPSTFRKRKASAYGDSWRRGGVRANRPRHGADRR